MFYRVCCVFIVIGAILKMPLESVQYRSAIRLLFKKGKSKDEILLELNAVYEDQCPSRATVYRWYNYFKSGRTSVIDDDKPERPCEISGGITEKLKTIVKNK